MSYSFKLFTGKYVFYGLSDLTPFFNPFYVYSYDRIQPNTWSGAYQCWGKENREAPLRTACPPGVKDGVVSNFEIKSFDGCANPHLGLAAIIASGIDGLRRHLPLPEPIGKLSVSYLNENFIILYISLNWLSHIL